MKTAYKWFDYFLKWLFIGTFVFIVLSGFVLFFLNLQESTMGIAEYYHQYNTITGVLGTILPLLCLISFIFGVIYIFIGIILFIVNKGKKNKEHSDLAKRILFKGILRSVSGFVLFFIVSYALFFFSPMLPTSVGGQVVNDFDPNSPDKGFPVKDLKIINRKIDTDASATCDITIQNTNATLSAANVSVVDDGFERDFVTLQDHISPGKTYDIPVSGDSVNDPCKANISIHAAGVAR
jgi:hypothetical protein